MFVYFSRFFFFVIDKFFIFYEFISLLFGLFLLGCDNKDSIVKMDVEIVYDIIVLVVDGDFGGDIEEMLNDKGILDGFFFDNEVIREVGSVFIRFELDLVCVLEKLVNMNLFMMYVVVRESDIEVFVIEKEDILVDFDVKVLEFDVLLGIFDLEVREMDKFVCLLEREINNVCEIIFLYKYLGDVLLLLEEKLYDVEESMK